MKYIKTGRIQSILAESAQRDCPLYIMGPIGCGKTAAVEYFYRRTAHHVIDCGTGEIKDRKSPSRITAGTIIIDNVTYLVNDSDKRYVLDLIRTGKHIIFTARAPRPAWLLSSSFEKEMMVSDHRDLIMQKDSVSKFLKEFGAVFSEEDLLSIMEKTRGNPLFIKFIAFYMRDGEPYSEEIAALAKRSYYNYLDNELNAKISAEEMEVLLSLCKYPSFTFSMAAYLCNEPECQRIIDSISRKNAYIFETSNKTNLLREDVRRYLKEKRNIIWPKDKDRDNLRRGAAYYARENKILEALDCYKQAFDKENVIRLLEKNAEAYPEPCSVCEMRQYYLTLNDEDIIDSWPLTAAMCMLYSIMIKPDKSEELYLNLKRLHDNETDEYVRERIYSRIVYLDMVLPHRGTKNLRERCRKAKEAFESKPGEVRFRYGGMMPSVLHGMIDFSEESVNTEDFFGSYGEVLRSFSKEKITGMEDIIKAEIGYERDNIDHFELLTLLNRGYLREDASDCLSGCFAAVGVSVHLHLFRGEMQKAEELLDAIRAKAVNAKNDILLKSIDALYAWVDQLHVNRENVLDWLENTSDEGEVISFLERTELVCKIRALIIIGRFDAALVLSERVMAACDIYDRVYAKYEVMLYKAITLYRMKEPLWKDVMTQVLEKASELGFYHIICDHGIAVLPLLEKHRPETVDPEYFSHLLSLTRQMAENYPNYLMTLTELEEPLTKTERRVLHLLCEGLNAEEIADLMNISYSGIKFHNKNIYRKLGASNRTEAVRIAYRLGLNGAEQY